jgi:hypothetical protein
MDKIDIVERFLFINKLHERFNIKETSGVLFYKNTAFITSEYIAGRVVHADSSPSKNISFWCFSQKDYIDISNQFLIQLENKDSEEEMIQTLEQVFKIRSDSCIFFKKEELLVFIEERFKTESNKEKTVMIGEISGMQFKINFESKKEELSTQYNVPLYFNSSKRLDVREKDRFSINLMLFYEILKNSFCEYSIVGLKFCNSIEIPVIVFGKSRNLYKPYISWAIKQMSLKNKLRYKR